MGPSPRTRKFLRYWLPVLAWAGVISLLSTSAFQAGSTYGLLDSLLRLFFPDIPRSTLAFVHAVLRKCAHIAEYFVLSLLLWRALRGDAVARWGWRWALGALALSVAFAGLDEWHQSFERGRVGSAADSAYDSAGATLAQFWLWWRARPAAPKPHTGDPGGD